MKSFVNQGIAPITQFRTYVMKIRHIQGRLPNVEILFPYTIWDLLTLFPLFTTIVICSLLCLCILVAYIANNMDPDQFDQDLYLFASIMKLARVY